MTSPRILKAPSKLGAVLGIANLAIGVAIFSAEYEGSWGGFLFLAVNLPFSIPLMLLGAFLEIESPLFLLIGGALWWYVIGWWVEQRRRNQ